MKTAVIIRDGQTQVVLTPETPFEEQALKGIKTSKLEDLSLKWGCFYDCQGGWYREGTNQELQSLIIVYTEGGK